MVDSTVSSDKALHAAGLIMVIYLALTERALRRIIRRLLPKGVARDAVVIDIASDWALRTASLAVGIELIFVFSSHSGMLHVIGMVITVVGLLVLVATAGVRLGHAGEKYVGPAVFGWQPTLGTVIRSWLVLLALILAATLLEGVSS